MGCRIVRQTPCTVPPIKRINTMNPDGCGDFKIEAGPHMKIDTITNGIRISTTILPDAELAQIIRGNGVTLPAADWNQIGPIPGSGRYYCLQYVYNDAITENGFPIVSFRDDGGKDIADAMVMTFDGELIVYVEGMAPNHDLKIDYLIIEPM